MENKTFKVKNENFEGPIEVLLELIEKRKLFVNDVSLASVTDDFIYYIQSNKIQEDEFANFLAIASTLILIKARSLLPNIDLSPEENKSIDNLERRLALYQIINNISIELNKKYKNKISFLGIKRDIGIIFSPDPKITKENLHEFILDIKERAPQVEAKKPETSVQKTFSISDIISKITERIESALENIQNTITFDSIKVQDSSADHKTQKIYTIVSFLGMLELARRGFLRLDQENTFSTISISKNNTLSEEG